MYHAFRSIWHQFKFKQTPSPSLPHIIVLLQNCFLSGVQFFKLYGQFATFWHFKSLDYDQEKLEIAEDMFFTCNNNYSEHIRHILQHTGVIWNFHGIFQQRYQEVA